MRTLVCKTCQATVQLTPAEVAELFRAFREVTARAHGPESVAPLTDDYLAGNMQCEACSRINPAVEVLNCASCQVEMYLPVDFIPQQAMALAAQLMARGFADAEVTTATAPDALRGRMLCWDCGKAAEGRGSVLFKPPRLH